MNVESTSSTVAAKTSETSTSSSSTSKSGATSFKDELEAVKNQDVKTSQDTQQDSKASEMTDINNTQKLADDKAAQKTADENKENELAKALAKTSENQQAEIKKGINPTEELNSKIAKLNELFNNSKTQNTKSKTEDINDKNAYCQTMKMDNKDITFFLNLVDNQQMSAQNNQGIDLNGKNMFTDIKTEASHSPVQVSAALLDAINDSAKTGKPFRIDFDSDIAVVMKVDKEGVLSANFIPGSAAVEAYLKNNIATLRQNFDNQDLPYNELSYSNQQKQEQQEKQSKNNKENSNE